MRSLITIGKLDRLIRIERPTTTQDADYGTPVITWSTFATVWANVQEVLPSRAEGVVAGVRVARAPVRVRMRYLRDVTPDMRLKIYPWGHIPWGSRHWWTDSIVHQIVGGPTELGRRDGIELMVEQFSSDGQGGQ